MSNKKIKSEKLTQRICRLEYKCNVIINEIRALRASISPRHSELDEVIERLHKTAQRMRAESVVERDNIIHIKK